LNNNNPTCEKTRDGIQHKYHGREIIKEEIPAWIRIKKELASYFGITICSKCGTRTKMKVTKKSILRSDAWEGYTICSKCGYKEGWTSGLVTD